MSRFRLGLFGGTFDPPHVGHLVAAQEVAEELGLDQVLFVVAGLPPHKLGEPLSPAPIRLEMTRAAVAGNGLLDVSDIEMGREGPTYTVDTLRRFGETRPDADLFFLMGADQLAELQTWREPERLPSLATLVTMAREGIDPARSSPLELASGACVEFQWVPITRLDISSTNIRQRSQAGRSIRYLVPHSVQKIIESHRLYRTMS